MKKSVLTALFCLLAAPIFAVTENDLLDRVIEAQLKCLLSDTQNDRQTASLRTATSIMRDSQITSETLLTALDASAYCFGEEYGFDREAMSFRRHYGPDQEALRARNLALIMERENRPEQRMARYLMLVRQSCADLATEDIASMALNPVCFQAALQLGIDDGMWRAMGAAVR